MDYLIGFLVAAAVGLTGVGGGTLTVPLLILGLGVPAAEAVGTSLLFVTVTKLAATPVYFARGQVDRRAAFLLLAGGLPGVAAGSLLLARMRTEHLQPLVLFLVGLTIVVMALTSLWKLFRRPSGAVGSPRERWLPWLAAPIGLEVGFSSAGAGALGSLALMEFTALPAAKIVGTDLLFGLVVSAVGGGLHFAAGNVNQTLLWHLCLGGVLGATLGAHLATRFPSRALRTALTFFLVALGSQLFWRGLTGLR